MSTKIKQIYEYIHNLRLKTKRKNYYFQRRRVERGDGHRTLGWVLSDDTRDLITAKIKFTDVLNFKRELENEHR